MRYMIAHRRTYSLIPRAAALAAAVILAAMLTACGGNDEQAEVTPTPTPIRTSAAIAGTVTLAGADDHSGVMIYVTGTSLMGFTNQDGQFTIDGLKEGIYSVYARHDGYKTAVLDPSLRVGLEDYMDDIPIQLGAAELELATEKPSERDLLGGLKGMATLAGTADSTGITVQLRGTIHRTVTGPSGEFILPYVEPGDYAVTFFKTGFTAHTQNVTIGVGRVTTLDAIALAAESEQTPEAPTRTVEGTVEILDRQGHKQNIFDQVVVGLEGTRFTTIPDGSGAFAITGVPAGLYVITAAAPNYEMQERIELDLIEVPKVNVGVTLHEAEGARPRTGIVSGQIEVEFMGEGGHGGVVVGPLGHAHTALTAPDGSFIIANVPEGSYTIQAQKEGYVPLLWESVEVLADHDSPLGRGVLEKYFEPPRVVYTEPADAAERVVVQRRIPVFVRFNKKMNAESVKAALRLRPEVQYRAYMGKEHPSSDFDMLYLEIDGSNPKFPLGFKRRLDITLGADTTDDENQRLGEDYTFSFTTGEAEVIATRPQEGDIEANVTAHEPIVISFNAAIDQRSVEGQIDISPEPPGNYYTAVRNDPESGWSTLAVYLYLPPETNYTVRIKNGIKTLTGDRISNLPYTIKFRTLKVYTYDEAIQGVF